MAKISWLYKNRCENPYAITESYGTTNITDYGTQYVADNNLHTEWRANGISGSPSILFDFGSSVTVDSLIAIHNIDSTGTLYFSSGDTNPPVTNTHGLPIVGLTGTSIKYLNSQYNHRYWNLIINSGSGTVPARIKELYVGKRDELPINPEYIFSRETDASTITTQSEKGSKKVFHKYTRTKWDFRYSAIDNTLYGTMNDMMSICSGSYKPFYMCLDRDDNFLETYFVRFIKSSWRHVEIIDNCHDIDFSVDEEL